MEGGGSGIPDTTVEPSGLYPAAQIVYLGSHVMFSTCGPQTAHVVL